MPFSVRFDRDTERRVVRLAQATGRTRSQVVREAVAAYDVEPRREPARRATAYDRLARFIGVGRGGDPTLSRRTGEAFRQLLKARARRSR
jgi:predicted transcriptional regulator